MTYKGYELRNDAKTKFYKDGEVLELVCWGIYANGDFKGSVKTREQAMDYIDHLMQGALHRPKDRTHTIQRIDYDGRGRVVTTRVYREG